MKEEMEYIGRGLRLNNHIDAEKKKKKKNIYIKKKKKILMSLWCNIEGILLKPLFIFLNVLPPIRGKKKLQVIVCCFL